MRSFACFLLLACAGLAPAAAHLVTGPSLPKGARLRLGTPAWIRPPEADVVVISPDHRLVAYREGKGISIVEAQTGKFLHRVTADDGPLTPAAFTNDGERLAAF